MLSQYRERTLNGAAAAPHDRAALSFEPRWLAVPEWKQRCDSVPFRWRCGEGRAILAPTPAGCMYSKNRC